MPTERRRDGDDLHSQLSSVGFGPVSCPANGLMLSRVAAPPSGSATRSVARNEAARPPGQRTPLRRLLQRVRRRLLREWNSGMMRFNIRNTSFTEKHISGLQRY